jgi:uncharacterized 2Fe-2S/4Fe-4S cluster protein (DUF4445 family)
MTDHLVTFDSAENQVRVPTGTLLSEAARLAGVEVLQPCGGQGRCGRCAVQVEQGTVRPRSTLRLSESDVAAGYVLACQSVIEADVQVIIPPQEKIERRLTTDRVAAEVSVPAGYDQHSWQPIQRVSLTLTPPSMDDQTDDWGRLRTALRQQADIPDMRISLNLLQRVGSVLRQGEWQVTVLYETDTWDCTDCVPRLIDLLPGHQSSGDPIWATAIDIGTTTVSVWLVDLVSGDVRAQVAEYNGQIARGEDVISRIIYTGKNGGGEELRQRVLETINALLERACKRVLADPASITKTTIAGNSTMLHLLLGIPAASIRLSPFITAVNHIPSLLAGEVGLSVNPEARVDCLPGVASYVGADITSGVLSSGMQTTDRLTLFLDVGTNGETVLGTRDWLVTCACSAGPAFEGAGVMDGMRATSGAIEEVWINGRTFEPTYRVIGGVKPRGLCGSGLIALLAEMFTTGVVDKGGNLNTDLDTNRIREGEHGLEYVVAWETETSHDRAIAINTVDIDNLLRAKAAIYAGFTILADRVGVPLEGVEQVLIGGSFGKYINVENAVQIGLLPDMDWERFHFLGNTSVRGAYHALIDRRARQSIQAIADRMTYIELSADNTFYEAFTSALFLPHTDLSRFPSVAQVISDNPDS